MKTTPSLLLRHFQNRPSRRNFVILLRFLAVLIAMVGVYSVLFHFLMVREGQDYTWITGVYWTLTVMSTLGFGDITFHTDLGRLFSLMVLLSGVVFLLVLLPFTFIEFFYEPWMKARAAARVPTEVPVTMTDHVVLTRYGPITAALIEQLTRYGYPYIVILPDFDEALAVHDQGIEVMHGDIDDPETYRRARIESAALMATTRTDIVNTSAIFAAREVTTQVRMVATATGSSAAEILRVAGCNRVLHLSELMGRMLARRARGQDATSHVIGRLDDVLIAEANAAETPLQGMTLLESQPLNTSGVAVVGLWNRGQFEIADGNTMVNANSVLVLAGSKAQFECFDELCREERPNGAEPVAPVIIIGGGRVGRATAKALAARGIAYHIVEMERRRVRDDGCWIHGNATDPDTLDRAGIRTTQTVIVTTRDDDTNVYLTIYCRRLRPDAQIISRATVDRNVAALHRAGSDFVYSYASMGANILFNLLKRSDVVMIAEGLDVFRVKLPSALAGKKISELTMRQDTGCSIVAVNAGEQGTVINPPATTVLAADVEIVLIGTVEAEGRFLRRYELS